MDGKKAEIESMNMTEKVVIITGANSGIGFHATEGLTRLGAHVIMACRREDETRKAIQLIHSTNPKAQLTYLHLDLSSLESVKNFVSEFKRLNLPLDVLICNAGLNSRVIPTGKTDIEYSFHVNHLGHFLLTELLLPMLEQTRGKVINVSSTAHTWASLSPSQSVRDLAMYSRFPDKKNQFLNYSFSKLCNIWSAFAMHRKYHAKTGVSFMALHPGFVNTNIWRDLPLLTVFKPFFYLLTKTSEQGAQTTLHCACVAKGSGQYYDNCQPIEPSSLALDVKRQDELYDLSRELVKDYLVSE
jgi:WW domain-containing oxidoreductase